MFNNYPGFLSSNTGALSTVKNGINWSSLLGNTQKVIGIINQSIPVFYQVKPIWNNAKTMFKVMGQLNSSDTKKNKATTSVSDSKNIQMSLVTNQGENPHFFL